MYLQEDAAFNNAINARLNRLFFIDGRDQPTHPHHGTFTGLAEKYRFPGARSKNLRAE